MCTREYGAEDNGRLVMELALPFEDDVVGVITSILLESVFVNAVLSSIINGCVASKLVQVSKGGFESSAIVMSKASKSKEYEWVEKSHVGGLIS
jgi:hypothetical protein